MSSESPFDLHLIRLTWWVFSNLSLLSIEFAVMCPVTKIGSRISLDIYGKWEMRYVLIFFPKAYFVEIVIYEQILLIFSHTSVNLARCKLKHLNKFDMTLWWKQLGFDLYFVKEVQDVCFEHDLVVPSNWYLLTNRIKPVQTPKLYHNKTFVLAR